MTDIYQSIANSPVGRKLLDAINAPVPLELERYSSDAKTLVTGNILLGGTKGSLFIPTIGKALESQATEIHHPQDDTIGAAVTAAIPSSVAFSAGQSSSDTTFKGVVFDASGIENSTELKALFDFFNPVIRKLEDFSRLIVIGLTPNECKDAKQSTAQGAIEGFTRSLAKEIGRNASTCQLIFANPNVTDELIAPLHFFLSPKSAYVSAQVAVVRKAKISMPKIDLSKPLANKTALVTGASRGIGAAIATTLARDGAKVICLDIPAAADDLHKIAADLNGLAIAEDITDPNAPKNIGKTLKAEFGGVDIIVHNAGVTRDKTLAGMKEHLWEQVIDINLSAEERINDYLLDNDILNKNGRIICVSSMSGIAGNYGQTNYACSKAGVISMVESMRVPLAKQNITINAVAPGFIETQMTDAMPFATREIGRRLNSLNQGGLPLDVAETIAFFASPAAHGVTGNVIRVCGQNLLGA